MAFNEKLLKKTPIDTLKTILVTFYIFDHLNNHFYSKIINYFIFIIGTNVSLETFSLLVTTFNKYSFLKIKTVNTLPPKNNIENNFQIKSSMFNNSTNVTNLDLCLFIGINTRYEATYLNRKLRIRYLKRDFLLFSISSLLDLTFSVFVLGSTTKTLNLIAEGNYLFNQKFKTANCPLVVTNSDYFKRIDANCVFILIEIFKSYAYFTLRNWNGFNVLNSSLNEVGIMSISNVNTLKVTDLIKFNAFYLINTPLYMSEIRTLIELKILNFFNSIMFQKKNRWGIVIREIFFPKIFFSQQSVLLNSYWFTMRIKKCFYLRNYSYIPTKCFFETYETYKNTEGLIKKSINVVKLKFNLKTDWQFLRRIFKQTNKQIIYLKNIKDHNLIYFNSKDIFRFKNFIALQFNAVKTFTALIFYHLSETILFDFSITFFYRHIYKNFNTKVKFWIEDFFIGGRDSYSKNSVTMIQCSLLLRIKRYSFYSKSTVLI